MQRNGSEVWPVYSAAAAGSWLLLAASPLSTAASVLEITAMLAPGGLRTCLVDPKLSSRVVPLADSSRVLLKVNRLLKGSTGEITGLVLIDDTKDLK